MIIKGTSRSGPAALAAHLGNAEMNERIELIEARGTIAEDLRGALLEMDAYAMGTRCQKPLYHAAISPAPPHRLTPEQRMEAITALEDALGFSGNARVIVIHEKHDREHLHVVWSRIDLERMVSVSDSHNYRKHELVARDLERRFEHDRVQGAHVEREGTPRPDRTPSRAELRQEDRTGIKGSEVRGEVTSAYQASDGAFAFMSALEDKGFVLAQGDRRDFVIIDQAGGVHSLARRIHGVRASQLREFMAPLDRASFPNVEEAQAAQLARLHGERTDAEILHWDDALATAGIAKDELQHQAIRQQQEEEERRRREALDARAIDMIEAAYARGDDYVSQTRAAQRDHERRQRELRDHEASSGAEPQAYIDGVEITDDMAARLSQLPDENASSAREPDKPDRQPEAPGGGHTRSR